MDCRRVKRPVRTDYTSKRTYKRSPACVRLPHKQACSGWWYLVGCYSVGCYSVGCYSVCHSICYCTRSGMSTYNRSIRMNMVLSPNKEQWVIFQCSHCHNLPSDSVQTDCGHLLCVRCLQFLLRIRRGCPEIGCGKPLKEDGRSCYFRDEFVNSEVMRIPVACANSTNGCTWTGSAGNFLFVHIDRCQHH